MSALAFLLCLPTFAVLGALYAMFPRQPRPAARLAADLGALLAATVLSIMAMRLTLAHASGGPPIWGQVLAAAAAFCTFLAVLGLALALRSYWLRGMGSGPPP